MLSPALMEAAAAAVAFCLNGEIDEPIYGAGDERAEAALIKSSWLPSPSSPLRPTTSLLSSLR